MATYDRTAAKQAKKGKDKKKGAQQPARKRKHYNDLIPYRKMARMLQSSGPQFVGEMANRLKHDPKKGDNGIMGNRLMEMAADGLCGEFGARVQALAQEAMESVK